MPSAQPFRRLEKMIQIPEERAFVGIAFVPGAGFRVGIVQDGASEHMSAAAAWRKARDIEAQDDGELTPLAQALGLTAGRVRAMGLAGREPDGRA